MYCRLRARLQGLFGGAALDAKGRFQAGVGREGGPAPPRSASPGDAGVSCRDAGAARSGLPRASDADEREGPQQAVKVRSTHLSWSVLGEVEVTSEGVAGETGLTGGPVGPIDGR